MIVGLLLLVVIAVASLLPATLVAEKEDPVTGAVEETPYAQTPASAEAVDDRVEFGDLPDDVVRIVTKLKDRGFDDIELAPYQSPPLTTVRQSLTDVATLAARSDEGIYLHEADAVTVTSVTVSVDRADFDSGTTNLSQTLEDLVTTDTTAALRAAEIGAGVLLKGTKGDGVYDKDPKTHSDAVRFPRISFEDVYRRRLKVMDRTAITLCIENDLPIVVFDMTGRGNLAGVLRGDDIGTIVGADEETAHGR